LPGDRRGQRQGCRTTPNGHCAHAPGTGGAWCGGSKTRARPPRAPPAYLLTDDGSLARAYDLLLLIQSVYPKGVTPRPRNPIGPSQIRDRVVPGAGGGARRVAQGMLPLVQIILP